MPMQPPSRIGILVFQTLKFRRERSI